MSDKDFNLAFRRTSLDPLEINKHRFGKLIIDLQKQIGYDDWPEEWETSHTVEALKKEIREVHQAAWEKRKRMIERKVRIKFSKMK